MMHSYRNTHRHRITLILIGLWTLSSISQASTDVTSRKLVNGNNALSRTLPALRRMGQEWKQSATEVSWPDFNPLKDRPPLVSAAAIRRVGEEWKRTAMQIASWSDEINPLKQRPTLSSMGAYYGVPQSVMASTRTQQRSQALALSDIMSDINPLNQRPSLSSMGVYYGLTQSAMASTRTQQRSHTLSLSDTMSVTLEEMRMMRKEMEALRRELHEIKRSMNPSMATEEEEQPQLEEKKKEQVEDGVRSMLAKRDRAKDYEKIGKEVERWAQTLLYEEGEEQGWQEVTCSKVFQKSFNNDGRTKAYVKWMKDSRGKEADKNDNTEYPCIKVFTTFDAPIENVCSYLAEEARLKEYNDLIVKHRDLEELTPYSKICWGMSPHILFIKPREFVTYCHHRWLRDGTQVVINQACDHPDAPEEKKERDVEACRAYALRGANYISSDPEDPQRTRFTFIAHANPGGVAPWACKTAVNALAPIEPFKLCHKINQSVKLMAPPDHTDSSEMVSSSPTRTNKPAGLAQLGYACFWPQGGGVREGINDSVPPQLRTQTPENEKKSSQRTAASEKRKDRDSASILNAMMIGL